jgi:hypothetical protein
MGVITRGNQRGRKRLAWVLELVVIFRVIGTTRKVIEQCRGSKMIREMHECAVLGTRIQHWCRLLFCPELPPAVSWVLLTSNPSCF